MIHTPPSAAVVSFRLSRAELEEVLLAALAAGERERVSRLRELLGSRPAEAALGRHAGRSRMGPGPSGTRGAFPRWWASSAICMRCTTTGE